MRDCSYFLSFLFVCFSNRSLICYNNSSGFSFQKRKIIPNRTPLLFSRLFSTAAPNIPIKNIQEDHNNNNNNNTKKKLQDENENEKENANEEGLQAEKADSIPIRCIVYPKDYWSIRQVRGSTDAMISNKKEAETVRAVELKTSGHFISLR